MAAIKTINLPYRCVETSVTHMNGRARGAAEAVLYGADGSLESAAMADVLNEMGVEFEYRSVSLDPAARREWEDLDGESIPMLRLGNMGIVRGLDRIKVQQLFGWVGCYLRPYFFGRIRMPASFARRAAAEPPSLREIVNYHAY